MVSFSLADRIGKRLIQTKIKTGGSRVFVPDRLLRLPNLQEASNIGGILSLQTKKGSVNVHLPNDEVLSIGSHVKSDVRIKGSAPSLLIRFDRDDNLMRISTLTENGAEIVSKSGKRRTLLVQLNLDAKGEPLQAGDTIRIKTIVGEKVEWLETTFRGWDPLRSAAIGAVAIESALEPRPAIATVDVSPPEPKTLEKPTATALTGFDKRIVSGTMFKDAEHLEDVFNILLRAIGRYNRHDKKSKSLYFVAAACLVGGISLTAVLSTISVGFSVLAIPSVLVPGMFIIKHLKDREELLSHQEKLVQQLRDIIKRIPAAIVNQTLDGLNPQKRKNIYQIIQDLLQLTKVETHIEAPVSTSTADLSVPEDVANPAGEIIDGSADTKKVES